MRTKYPEAYGDSAMQKLYEDEKKWGLPHSSFDSFMHHSVIGVGNIKEFLGLKGGDGPFSWGDDDMHNAASVALLVLRNKKDITETEFAQFCWLELSLMEEVSYCLVPPYDKETERRLLSRFSHLVDNRQIEFLRSGEQGLLIDCAVDEVVDPSPQLIKETSDRIKASIQHSFSSLSRKEDQSQRKRIFEYLMNIVGNIH